MLKADLHVHSKYSEHPSIWFLQRIGAAESYTEPDYIYHELKAMGMDFVTITDHNRIEAARYLKYKHPEDTFISVEVTTYFPEDQCKIHLLVYDITPGQFDEIQTLRKNIYDLRKFVIGNNIAYSVAHATYSIDGRLTLEHLEKLILMFDVFEGINGGRSKNNNEVWFNVVTQLTEAKFNEFREKHGIEPNPGARPWEKSFTGGSDDHAGLFMGKTWTRTHGKSLSDFLENLRKGQTMAEGRHNDYRSFTFAIYKIGIDFSRRKSKTEGIFSQLNDFIFENKPLSLLNRMILKSPGWDPKAPETILRHAFDELVESLRKDADKSVDRRFSLAYEKIADVVDAFFGVLLDAVNKEMIQGDIVSIITRFSSIIPGVFLTLPFFTNLHFMYKNTPLLQGIEQRFGYVRPRKPKRILWFTDTFDDLNGVSATLRRVFELSVQEQHPIAIASASESRKDSSNYMEIPWIHEFKLPYYENYKLKIPSPLRALDKIQAFEPDEIVISTPGPIGLFGLLAAKLMHVKCVGIFHTDFTLQAEKINKEESLIQMIEDATRWFYLLMDEIRVPTKHYIDILEKRGLDRNKMLIFPRGLDHDVFCPRPHGKTYLQQTHKLGPGYYFLFTGRVSHDKSISVILDAFKELAKSHDNIYLLIVGDGPHRREYQRDYPHPRIVFTGRIDRQILPMYYSGCDWLLFPSRTDTYGMSVLEAQACGLPAVVSNEGGPQEIVLHNETGFVVDDPGPFGWLNMMAECLKIAHEQPKRMADLQQKARDNAVSRSDWNAFFSEILDFDITQH